MIDATRTTSALLDALHDAGNREAWSEFDGRYRPILINLGRRAGLSDVDSADAAQDTLADFFKSYRDKRYDRARGRLRQWLIGIARLKIADVRRARAKGAAQPADGAEGGTLSEAADEPAWHTAWDQEQRAAILRQALDQLRASDKLHETTLAAFELVAIRGVPAAEAASALNLSTQEVYLAKSRCMERIRTLIQRLESAFDQD